MLAHVQPFSIPAAESLPESVAAELPDFLRRLVALDPQARAERLTREFFAVEEVERHRLHDILSWHAKDAVVIANDETAASNTSYHPLSIAAGVEKGHLNRYKNMYPVRPCATRQPADPAV